MRNKLFYVIWAFLPLIAILHCIVYATGQYNEQESLYWVYRLGVISQTFFLLVYAAYIAKPHKAAHYFPVLCAIPLMLIPESVYYITGNLYFDILLIVFSYTPLAIIGLFQELALVSKGQCLKCGKIYWVQNRSLNRPKDKYGIIRRKHCPSCKKGKITPLSMTG